VTPNTENQRYQQQRLQAIKSAAAVFAEKGFHGSSTKDIAEHMGIKQGSLYYYFKSKEEALGEVCLFGIEDYVEHEALKVYNDERLYLPKAKRKNLKALGSGYRQLLEGIFEDGIRSGELRDSIDSHFAAQAVIGICNAWGDLIVRDPDLDLFEIIQKCSDLLLNGFRERRAVKRSGARQ
jgi:AcrR family transcriptional regulator